MSKIRALSTAAYSGFLFGDLRKNIPQIVSGLISKQIVVMSENDFFGGLYVKKSEETFNYCTVLIDLTTLTSELGDVKETQVNSSINRTMTSYFNLDVTRLFIESLTKKVDLHEQTD